MFFYYSQIPVYRGATKAIIKKTVPRKSFYGFDGFGDADFVRPITARVDKSKHAAVALVELVKKYSGKLVIFSSTSDPLFSMVSCPIKKKSPFSHDLFFFK